MVKAAATSLSAPSVEYIASTSRSTDRQFSLDEKETRSVDWWRCLETALRLVEGSTEEAPCGHGGGEREGEREDCRPAGGEMG